MASPVIFWQIWRFVAPGLYRHEKKVILPFSLLSSICFISGSIFGYLVIFPPAFKFLTSYSSEHLAAMPAVNEYFSLALRLLIAFGVIFELPVFMVLLAKVGMINTAFLKKNRKYAFLLSFVIAAIVTPTPDVVNQVMMAIPMAILYEISIVAVWLFGRRILPDFNHETKEDPEGNQDVVAE
ncbi:MAG: twin-arginine translocase subunit TatC [Desulfobulbaceae bacterium]|nr:twin-arginine translocase subunit TatC [Desulfobulbaceae bacterium]